MATGASTAAASAREAIRFMRRMLASPPVAARRPGSPRNPSADGIIHCRAGCDSGAQAIACGVEGAHGVGMRMGL